ncbi:MAG: cache domain-containing protein [Bacillota bacterium]
MNIYSKYKDSKSKDEIRTFITDALRSVRFNNGRGYYFIYSLEGDVILYPILPESEGANLIDLKDAAGNYSIRDEIELFYRYGEGFIRGYWTKPDSKEKMASEKITFAKKFEPYDWYAGTGEYIEYVIKDIQNAVLKSIRQLVMEIIEKTFFIVNYVGVEIANDVYRDLVGKNLWDMTDISGRKVIQEEIQIAKQHRGGGYITYYWNKPDNEVFEKLTFIRGIDEWGWAIGTGVNWMK